MTIRRGLKWGGIRVIAGFWMYEAILEYLPYLQHFSSGRHPALEDFAASAAPLTTVPVIARLSGYFKPRNEVFATHLAFSRALVAQMMSFCLEGERLCVCKAIWETARGGLFASSPTAGAVV